MPVGDVFVDLGTDRLRFVDGAGRKRTAADFAAGAPSGSQTVISSQRRELVVFTVTDTPAAVAANTSAEEAMTATGLLTTDIPLELVPPSAQPAGLSIGGLRVSAADTLQVRFGNHTGLGITPAAGDYTLVVLR